MEPTIAEIRLFAGNFAPRSWAFCDGQLLAISQNQALFSLLGTIYGGDGRTTFALPDLRGRFAVSEGRGAGLPDYRLGQKTGIETKTLIQAEMPPHTHVLNGSSAVGTNSSPENLVPAKAQTEVERGAAPKPVDMYDATPSSGTTLASGAVLPTGGSQNFSVRNPYLSINYIICLQGVFPSRS